MKRLKFQKMSDWNELSSIAGKKNLLPNLLTVDSDRAKFPVVYRTFLYNPTNLKVPKKHRA